MNHGKVLGWSYCLAVVKEYGHGVVGSSRHVNEVVCGLGVSSRAGSSLNVYNREGNCMRLVNSLVGVLLAVCALTAVVASAAQAVEGPYWKINGTRLSTGGTPIEAQPSVD
jgi:hypothetical protein